MGRRAFEDGPDKYFMDDEKYSRREVLEQNVVDADLLRYIDFFRRFGRGFLDELLSAPEGIRKVLVMPDSVLIQEGARGDSMVVISKGKVAVSVNGTVVAHLGEGSYFGELVFLGISQFRTATVTAVTFCDVRIIYNETFNQVVAKYPQAQAALHDTIRKCQEAMKAQQGKHQTAQQGLMMRQSLVDKVAKALGDSLQSSKGSKPKAARRLSNAAFHWSG